MKKKITAFIATMIVMLLCYGCLIACGGNDGENDNGGENDPKPPLTHDCVFEDYEYNNDATCIKDGTETSKCKFCDKKDTRKSAEYLATGEHLYLEYKYNNDATCAEDGTETAKCENCDKKDTRKCADHPATGEHLYLDYKYNNDATCAEDGTETAKCENCEETDTRKCADHPATGDHIYDHNYCRGCGQYEPGYKYTKGLGYGEVLDGEDVMGYEVNGIGDATDTDIIVPYIHNGKPVLGIGDYAFNNNANLTGITIPDSVTTIGQFAFKNCVGLTDITVPAGVKSIGGSAFADCKNLTFVTISSNVTSIGAYAFYGCGGLTDITIPSGVTDIGVAVFGHCNGLTVYCEISEMPSAWDANWNDKCPVVWNSKNNNVDEDGYRYAVIDGLRYALKGGVASVVGQSACISGRIVIPDNVTYDNTIYDVTSITSTDERYGAFWNCSGITSVTVPAGAIDISYGAFYGCDGLTELNVSSGNTKYHSVGNCIIETANKRLAFGCKASVIPNDGSVTKIGPQAFSGYNRSIEVTIPDSIKEIEQRAFSGCKGLTKIVIPDGVTSIGGFAFEFCSSLTDVTLSDNTLTIWEGAFYSCDSLRYNEYDGACYLGSGTNPYFALIRLKDYTITSCTVHKDTKNIAFGAFRHCDSLTTVTIPSGIVYINGLAFGNCVSLTDIHFDGSIMQWNAFDKYSGWNSGTGNYTVICKDGKLDKSGNMIS